MSNRKVSVSNITRILLTLEINKYVDDKIIISKEPYGFYGQEYYVYVRFPVKNRFVRFFKRTNNKLVAKFTPGLLAPVATPYHPGAWEDHVLKLSREVQSPYYTQIDDSEVFS